MARLSKTVPFDIYEDPDIAEVKPHTEDGLEKETVVTNDCRELPTLTLAEEEEFVTESEDESGRVETEDEYGDGDNERDVSMTEALVSPTLRKTSALDVPLPWTPTLRQPSLLAPDSIPRRAMSSPAQPFAHSLRGSTPRSARSRAVTPKPRIQGIARSRKQAFLRARDETNSQQPLVLLHAKLLPVSLPWNLALMREVLPKRVLDNLQLLRSRATETVLQRGVLIPHPGEDYELLEERLLEALELQAPRITKCGHFRARESASSTLSNGSTASDSGLGSSVEGLDDELCSACHHHISATKGKWRIRVFAANGLMRANTWAAAWGEMERVDVEIMPFISDKLRMRLDERQAELQSDGCEGEEEEAAGEDANPLFEEEIHGGAKLFELGEPAEPLETMPDEDIDLDPESDESREDHPVPTTENAKPDHQMQQPSRHDLPPIYRPKDIPLSVLLRNYVVLLAQDRKKVAIFFACLMALFVALRPSAIPRPDPFVPGEVIEADVELPGSVLTDVLLAAAVPENVVDQQVGIVQGIGIDEEKGWSEEADYATKDGMAVFSRTAASPAMATEPSLFVTAYATEDMIFSPDVAGISESSARRLYEPGMCYAS